MAASRFFLHQYFIIKIMDKMGYKVDKKGMCDAIAFFGAQALLLGDLSSFVERIRLVSQILGENQRDFSRLITAIQFAKELMVQLLESAKIKTQQMTGPSTTEAEFKQIFENQKNTHLAALKKDERLLIEYLLDIQAFFDGIAQYHMRHKYAKISINELPYKKEEIIDIILSSELKKKGKGIVEVDQFTGIYTVEDLTNYFSSLKQAIMESIPTPSRNKDGLPVMPCFLLESKDHVISIGYDVESSDWILINANNLPGLRISTDKNMAFAVAEAFIPELASYANPTVAMVTKMQSTQINLSFARQLKNNWRKSAKWHALHKIEAEKITETDYVADASWLFITSTQYRNTPLAVALVKAGADPNQAVLDDNTTPFYHAVRTNNITLAKAMLNHQANPNVSYFRTGCTPLMMAIMHNNLEMLRLILDAKVKVNVNQINKKGETALFIAAVAGGMGFVHELIKAGADPALTRSDGKTAAIVARESGYEKVAEFLEHAAQTNLQQQHVVSPKNQSLSSVVTNSLTRSFSKNPNPYSNDNQFLLGSSNKKKSKKP